jgi:hypothetical protein
MTMPHLMNCEHSSNGWCLDCVKMMHDRLQERLAELEEQVEFAKQESEKFKNECLTVLGDARQRRVDTVAGAIFTAGITTATCEARYPMTVREAYDQAEALEAERERRVSDNAH